jgi:hypothetical protein
LSRAPAEEARGLGGRDVHRLAVAGLVPCAHRGGDGELAEAVMAIS